MRSRFVRSHWLTRSESRNSTWLRAISRPPRRVFGSSSVGSTRQRVSTRSTGLQRPSPNSFRREGFDATDSQSDPRPWLDFQAHQNAAHHNDGCDDDHSHHEHDQAGHPHRSPPGRQGNREFRPHTRGPRLRAMKRSSCWTELPRTSGRALLRVKGLLNIAEEPGRPAVIQGAQHLLHTMTWLDRWPDGDHRSRIIFITQGIARDSLRDIIDLLDRVSSRTFKGASSRPQGARDHNDAD